MADLTQIIQASTAHAWLYLPLAALLGALPALQPGHAKSLMAAYIVAIPGTTSQALTLALSAAVGHTIVVWPLPITALAFGERYIVEQAEPWLTLPSGVRILLLALRMFWALRHRGHAHDHGHAHPQHPHGRDPGHHHHAPPRPGHVTTGQI